MPTTAPRGVSTSRVEKDTPRAPESEAGRCTAAKYGGRHRCLLGMDLHPGDGKEGETRNWDPAFKRPRSMKKEQLPSPFSKLWGQRTLETEPPHSVLVPLPMCAQASDLQSPAVGSERNSPQQMSHLRLGHSARGSCPRRGTLRMSVASIL